MEPLKSQTAFDPMRTPFTSPAARFTYLELENPLLAEPKRNRKVLVKINSNTLVVEPIEGKAYADVPHALPPELLAVEQPNIRTCAVPGGRQKGCYAAVNGGCPLIGRYGRIGRRNIIIEKDGKVDSAPCDFVYCGITESGRPTSQVHYLLDQWNILTDRTTTPQNIIIDGVEQTVEVEVPHLAPFYEEVGAGRFAKPKEGTNGGDSEGTREGGDRENRPPSSV